MKEKLTSIFQKSAIRMRLLQKSESSRLCHGDPFDKLRVTIGHFCKSHTDIFGFIEELPGANTQDRTLEEARRNLIEAVQLVLDSNRQLLEEELKGLEVIKEDFGTVTA